MRCLLYRKYKYGALMPAESEVILPKVATEIEDKIHVRVEDGLLNGDYGVNVYLRLRTWTAVIPVTILYNDLACTKSLDRRIAGRMSSIFTARRVCIARTMPWQDVCLLVRLSHAGIESKQL